MIDRAFVPQEQLHAVLVDPVLHAGERRVGFVHEYVFVELLGRHRSRQFVRGCDRRGMQDSVGYGET
jgi:hypothetical protein